MAGLTNEDVYAQLQKLERRVVAANSGSTQREIESIATKIESIVPVICSDADIPAEIYYVYVGANCSPEWRSTTGTLSVENWDATDLRQYARSAGTAGFVYGNKKFAWYNGPFGLAHSFDPKQADVSVFVMEFRARFTGNADYTTSGIGLLNSTPVVSTLFATATDHFIQVLRNAGSWELGSCDGTTISQTSGGSADGNFHDFKVEWASLGITLYVDDVLTITKSTNLPAQALAFAWVGHASAGNIDMTAVKMSWR